MLRFEPRGEGLDVVAGVDATIGHIDEKGSFYLTHNSSRQVPVSAEEFHKIADKMGEVQIGAAVKNIRITQPARNLSLVDRHMRP